MLLRVCTGFSTNLAVALSNITIVGGSIANFAFNVGKRHHFMDRPLIDWDLILVMEPATILGALLGGYMNTARAPNNSTDECTSCMVTPLVLASNTLRQNVIFLMLMCLLCSWSLLPVTCSTACLSCVNSSLTCL